MEACGNDNDGRSVIKISNVVVKFTCKAILKVLDNMCPFLNVFQRGFVTREWHYEGNKEREENTRKVKYRSVLPCDVQ